MNPDNLRPLRQRLTPRQLRRREHKLDDRREYGGERHLHARQRLTRLHAGWTRQVVFAVDLFKNIGGVTVGALARGFAGMRASDRRYGKYTTKLIGKSHARRIEPGESA